MVSKEELRKVPRDTNFCNTFGNDCILYFQNNEDLKFLDEFNYIIRLWKYGINR